jgi:5-methylcytosine-specific restriction protein A
MGSRNQRSEEAKAWRHLYKTKEWQALRRLTFLRDQYTCQMCGNGVSLDHKHPHAAVCDHIRDHKGDPALFHNPRNLRTLGKSCHDRHAQKEAHGTLGPVIGPDGWPVLKP